MIRAAGNLMQYNTDRVERLYCFVKFMHEHKNIRNEEIARGQLMAYTRQRKKERKIWEEVKE